MALSLISDPRRGAAHGPRGHVVFGLAIRPDSLPHAAGPALIQLGTCSGRRIEAYNVHILKSKYTRHARFGGGDRLLPSPYLLQLGHRLAAHNGAMECYRRAMLFEETRGA
jgi:hypothetical protein